MLMRFIHRDNFLYLAICLAMMVLSVLFSHTAGLLLPGGGEVGFRYANELKSSGSDDDITILAGVILFFFPLLTKFIRLNKCVNAFDLSVLFLAFLLQGFVIMAIEIGSITDTIIHDYNFVLAFWIVGFISVPIYVWVKVKRATRDGI